MEKDQAKGAGVQGRSLRDRLGQWEARLAPLSEKQKDSFMELSSAATFRPFPAELPLGEDPSVRARHEGAGGEGVPRSSVQVALDRIENPQQFMAWFDEVEAQVQADQDKCYRDYSGQLREYRDQCAAMLSEVTQALELLKEMRQKHEFVSHKTGALHQACEQLMEDQMKLVNVAESISCKLSYFNELEKIGSHLSSPTLSVTAESFVATLARLDECISFIEQNPHYKESQVYLARFKQYLSRALSFVKQHVVTTLKSTTRTIAPKQGTVEVLSENSYAQYYGKFRTNAPKIKALMREIEERTEKTVEYRTLLQDCHLCYVSQRGLLLTPTVTATIEQLKKMHTTDHCGLVRAGCNFLCRVCQDEYQLFFHFFSAESTQLNGLLESLCYLLYDTLRPVVIHINHLETLAELCSIFKVEMLEERVQPRGGELASFGGVVKQLLEDVQQRLVFRTQRYIQTDIRGYTPSPGDLAYPDKLIVAANALQDQEADTDSVFDTSGTESDVATSLEAQPEQAGGERGHVKNRGRKKGLAAVDMHAMWYPTVRRTLLCLSKLYRCIEKPVFEGVAQEALAECVRSLQFASDAIKNKKLPMDAQLFLIKHLLILREQIAAFDVDFAVTEVSLDWTKTKAAAFGLFKKKSRMFSMGGNNAFLEFFLEGIPDIVETHLDSKKEVDLQLKCMCEQFIADTTTSLIHPLKSLLSKCDVIFQLAEKDSHDPATLLHHQPFAGADDVHKVVSEVSKLLRSQVPSVRRSLGLYLANEETEHILFRPIRAGVLQTYESLEKIVTQYYSSEDQFIVSCPSQDQSDVPTSLEAQPEQAGGERGHVKSRGRKKGLAAVDMHAMWYPTVRRTLLCLSKLYRCIEKPVFEGVAQEALAECVRSLQFASDAIKNKKLPMDAQLFLIKHLLILREQIAAFDVDFAVTEVSLDWTKTKAAAFGLFKKKSRMFSMGGNNAFLEFFLEGIPDIVETHLDSKKEVDLQLKCMCEQFIADTTTSLIHPLKSLLSKYDVIFQLAEKDSHDPATLLHHQPFAGADDVHKVVSEVSKLLRSQVPSVRRSLGIYLANEETEHILFRPIRAGVLQTYESLEKIVTQYYSSEDQFIVSCPSQDQSDVPTSLEAQPEQAGGERGHVKNRGRKKGLAAVDMHAMWYPTVRRTLLCLSKLYRCIEKPVFEGVAQEALAECVRSLQFASDAIKNKKLPMDAQLFLIKHLLILREQIAAFDVDFAVTEVSLDWTKTKAAAFGLFKKKSRMFSMGGNNAFLEFFLEGIPDIVETHLDSKKEVDLQLKCMCEQFIADTTTSLIHPLKSLLSKYDVIFQLAEKDSHDPATLLHHQPFAGADDVHKVVSEVSKLLRSQVPSVRRSLGLYLANEETEHILFRPIRAGVLQTYESLEKIVTQYYSSEDQFIVSCPSQDQVSLMLALQADK